MSGLCGAKVSFEKVHFRPKPRDRALVQPFEEFGAEVEGS